jgi:hypothetical protein
MLLMKEVSSTIGFMWTHGERPIIRLPEASPCVPTHCARPTWREKAVAFDGDDYLASLLPQTLRSKEFTVFLVAALEVTGGDFPVLLSHARRYENDFTSGLAT